MTDDRLRQKLAWFVDHLDSPPMQLHRPFSVWADQDGSGSLLGSPAYSGEWRRWLESASGREIVTETILCYHVGRPLRTICEVCAIRDEDGRPIAESGLRRCEREVYRWPMRAAIASLANVSPAADLPDLATTLVTLARAGGDPASTVDVLARRWPKMTNPVAAHAHFLYALERVRAIWPKYTPE